MKGKYIAIAAAVALGSIFMCTGCSRESRLECESCAFSCVGCTLDFFSLPSRCTDCYNRSCANCADCASSVVNFNITDCDTSGCDTSLKAGEGDESNSRTLKSSYVISSAPLAGTKSYSVITVKLDYALYGGETPVSDAHIHSHLDLADGRTISATQEVGDIYDGQEKSAEFKFYVERDIQPETCAFSYALYGNA